MVLTLRTPEGYAFNATLQREFLMSFVFNNLCPPPAHTYHLEQLRTRRAKWLSALNSLSRAGHDDELVKLAAESFMLDNECDHLAHEGFAKGDPAKQARIGEIIERIWRIREEMAEMQAQSLAGVFAKATVGIEPLDLDENAEVMPGLKEDPLRFLLGSLLDDLERMAPAVKNADALTVAAI